MTCIVSHFPKTALDFYLGVCSAMTSPSPHEKVAFEAAIKAVSC